MTNPSNHLSLEDLGFYVDAIENNASMQQSPTKGFQLYCKPDHGHVGIYNHGNTCYMNVLLQYLHADSTFKNTIYRETTDHPLLNQLKRLFISLDKSNAIAVNSHDLIQAFGWPNEGSNEQQDVYELFSLLMDKLQQVSPHLDEVIKRIFEGKQKDELLCTSCSYKNESYSSFLNVSINVPDALENEGIESERFERKQYPLEGILEQHLKSETLGEENKWTCSQCQQNVRAVRNHKYEKVPDRLVIHLNRMRFDPTTKRRRKLSTAVSLPESLPLSCIGGTGTDAQAHESMELVAVLVHIGNASGGHYRAIIKNTKNGPENSLGWFDYNDAVVSELSQSDVENYFGNGDASIASLPDPVHPNDNANPLPPQSPRIAKSGRLLVSENAYMLVYRRRDEPKVEEYEVTDLIRQYQEEIEIQNANLKQFDRLRALQQKIVDMVVYFPLSEESVSSISLQSSYSKRNNNAVHFCQPTMESKGDGHFLKVHCYIDGNSTLESFTDMIHSHINEISLSGQPSSESKSGDGQFARLRQFYATSSRRGETFTGRESSSLRELFGKNMDEVAYHGYYPPQTLILEVRQESDPPFVEFNPRDVTVDIVFWQNIVDALDAENIELSTANSSDLSVISVLKDRAKIPRLPVTVPGEDQANLLALAASIVATYALRGKAVQQDQLRLTLLHCNTYNKGVDVVELPIQQDEATSRSQLLRRDYNVWAGDEIIVEIVDPSESTGQSFDQLRRIYYADKLSKQRLQLFFNNPLPVQETQVSCDNNGISTTIRGQMSSYEFSVEVFANETLKAVKSRMAAALGIQDLDSFYLRRSVGGQQLKDLSQTISEAGLANMSPVIIHNDFGKGADVGECILSLDLDFGAALQHLKNLTVSEKLTTLQLKETIFDKWAELSGEIPSIKPKSARHIRLRDGKGGVSMIASPSATAITTVYPILRDDKVLQRCLLGGSMGDGYRDGGRVVVIQVLDEAEILSADDIAVHVLPCNYKQRNIASSFVVPLKRTTPVEEYFSVLSKSLEKSFPDIAAQTSSIEFAKILNSGPPFSLKNANKLKWLNCKSVENADNVNLNDRQQTIDRPPFSIREGTVIAIRDRGDYDAAKEIAMARRNASDKDIKDGDENGRVMTAVGNGLNAVKARANIKQIRAMSSQGKRSRQNSESNLVDDSNVSIEVFAK